MGKSQVDRLGDRLRRNTPSESDLRELDSYRRSFAPAYTEVLGALRLLAGVESTGRPSKSTSAIVEKLHRESIRLSQIQDIAGVRVVVPTIEAQDGVVQFVLIGFPAAAVTDRRESPSNGYRAVHVVVRIGQYAVEVQVRTALQHRWAELSEKLADRFDPSIKYGGGPANIQSFLSVSSKRIAEIEYHVREARRIQSGFEPFKDYLPQFKIDADAHYENAKRLEAIELAALEELMLNLPDIGEDSR